MLSLLPPPPPQDLLYSFAVAGLGLPEFLDVCFWLRLTSSWWCRQDESGGKLDEVGPIVGGRYVILKLGYEHPSQPPMLP
eukprot:s58_g51.t1